MGRNDVQKSQYLVRGVERAVNGWFSRTIGKTDVEDIEGDIFQGLTPETTAALVRSRSMHVMEVEALLWQAAHLDDPDPIDVMTPLRSDLLDLANTICAPVYHTLEKSEYEKWVVSVHKRLQMETHKLEHIVRMEGLNPLNNTQEVQMLMRAKMTVDSVEAHEDKKGETLRMTPVTSGSEENKSFSEFTPSGDLRLEITNPALVGKIEAGEEFYVDFTKVVKVPVDVPDANPGDPASSSED